MNKAIGAGMTSGKTQEYSFSLAEYCLAHVNRVFMGDSYGRIDLPADVKDKRMKHTYRDRDGNECQKKDLATSLKISESSLTRIFADHYYDHIEVHRYLDERKAKLADKIEIDYFFDNGEMADSVILAKHYGVDRQFVSKKYHECKNDYIMANQKILEHSVKLKARAKKKREANEHK